MAQLVPLLFSRRRSARYSDRLQDFLSSLLDFIRMFISTVSFLTQLNSATLWLYVFMAFSMALTDTLSVVSF